MQTGRFDVHAFHTALDAARKARGFAWHDVAKACDLSPAMLTRLKQGHMPSAHSLLALSTWAEVNPMAFVFSGKAPAEGVDPMTAAIMAINTDPKLTIQSRTLLSTVLLTTYQQLHVQQLTAAGASA